MKAADVIIVDDYRGIIDALAELIVKR